MKDLKRANMRLTLLMWLVFFVVGMALMLVIGMRKTIVITNMTRDSAEYSNTVLSDAGTRQREAFPGRNLQLTWEKTKESSFRIPLKAGLKAENVVMENRYMDRELWIYIQGVNAEFYEENSIYGTVEPIKEGWCEAQEDGVILKLQMEGILEYHSTMEDSSLVIVFYEPQELYERIVVIDPVGGGSERGILYDGFSEKELALQVVKQLQKKTISPDIKLYFTRMEDMEITDEERISLVEEVNACMFIRIGASEDPENTENYGIASFYNENYFIPQFGNVELADIVTREVTLAASNRAAGLLSAPEDSILSRIKIPAAELSLGYMSNPKENALLAQESYQEKLAAGIANAILEACSREE